MSSLGSSPYARSEVSISLSDLDIGDGIVNSTLDAQIALEVPDVDQQRIRLVLFPDYEDFKALWGEIDAVQQKRKKLNKLPAREVRELKLATREFRAKIQLLDVAQARRLADNLNKEETTQAKIMELKAFLGEGRVTALLVDLDGNQIQGKEQVAAALSEARELVKYLKSRFNHEFVIYGKGQRFMSGFAQDARLDDDEVPRWIESSVNIDQFEKYAREVPLTTAVKINNVFMEEQIITQYKKEQGQGSLLDELLAAQLAHDEGGTQTELDGPFSRVPASANAEEYLDQAPDEHHPYGSMTIEQQRAYNKGEEVRGDKIYPNYDAGIGPYGEDSPSEFSSGDLFSIDETSRNGHGSYVKYDPNPVFQGYHYADQHIMESGAKQGQLVDVEEQPIPTSGKPSYVVNSVNDSADKSFRSMADAQPTPIITAVKIHGICKVCGLRTCGDECWGYESSSSSDAQVTSVHGHELEKNEEEKLLADSFFIKSSLISVKGEAVSDICTTCGEVGCGLFCTNSFVTTTPATNITVPTTTMGKSVPTPSPAPQAKQIECCSNCHEIGHVVASCQYIEKKAQFASKYSKSSGSDKSTGNLRCNACKKFGHLTEHCWTLKTCGFCGKKGHIEQKCRLKYPNLAKQRNTSWNKTTRYY